MRTGFRTTLWFKKGLLDAEAARTAAASGDALQPSAFDLIPVEDRYADDGSITAEDHAWLSLASGTTEALPRHADAVSLPGDVDVLVHDLTQDRYRMFVAITGSLVALIVLAIAAL